MTSSTQDLLEMISTLRQRLEQAQDLVSDASSVANSVLDERRGPHRLQALRLRAEDGLREQEQLERTLSRADGIAAGDQSAELPTHLTARARRLLQQSRTLLARLRILESDAHLEDERDPERVVYQDTLLLTEFLLRAIPMLPDDAGMQLRMASGMDVLLADIVRRAGSLESMSEQARGDREQIAELSRLLQRLRKGELADWNDFFSLAETVAREADEGKPLRFCHGNAAEPANFVAAHSLSVARVVARVARAHEQWRSRLLQPVTAALVHDVGMLAIPVNLLSYRGELNEENLGVVEKHCLLGARWVSRIEPRLHWLIEATRGHHERPDGLGYPAGLMRNQTEPLARFLSVCDVYAALCCDRPQRKGLDTLSALAEVQRRVQKNMLDGEFVNLVSQLSSYPAGVAVELNDGSQGIVLAAQPLPFAEKVFRYTIALLNNAKRKPLPYPRYVEVTEGDGRFITRGLDDAERRKSFGDCYPQWV